MNCPKCATPTLSALSTGRSGTRIDRCSSCAGTFLDFGELAPAVDDPAAAFDSGPAPAGADGLPASCPRCKTGMRAIAVPDETFHVDRCMRCGAIFLDRGELGALAARHLADGLDELFRPGRGAPPPGATQAAAPAALPAATGLGPKDRALLANAVELAARFPEAAEFLRKQLKG